ncbi:MAG: ribonuclease III [Spirochaetaceae bacterium]|nr:MAG: ribonuclease III [Spirochaetaceae bacterium]
MLLPKKSSEYRTPAVSSQRRKELQLFERKSGIKFRDIELLNLAFAHRSFANESSQDVDNNERLEFLGDSVLGLVVAEYLFENLTDRAEGDLAKIKSFVVSEDSLAEIARRIEVDSYILIGKGEEYSGGRNKKALLADCMEAIIGAFFVDSGFRPARKFVLRHIVPEITKVLEDRHRKDYKTLLQEHVQKTYKTYPRYNLVKKTGPDHDKTFWIEVVVNEKSYGPGKGANKKEAEQNAAALAFETIHRNVKATKPAKPAKAAKNEKAPKPVKPPKPAKVEKREWNSRSSESSPFRKRP